MKIAIIGVGNLGLSIAEGILQSDLLQASEQGHLQLTKRDLTALQHLSADQRVSISSDNCAAVAEFEVVILAVQPAQLTAILETIQPILTPAHTLISTVTGVSLAHMEQVVGSAQALVRSMPNTAISVGASMTCLCANAAGQERIDLAKAIFEQLGHALPIPERQMQAATVICASGVAFWMRLIRATTQGAIQLGFDAKEAQQLAMHTCSGAAQLLIASGKHPEEEIDRVTTPMGCTIQGLNEMEIQGLSSSLIQGIVASYNKITEFKTE
jgi:pyrroline-5-carboxylate reductase